MSSIISNIIGIAEKITQIPTLIAQKLGLDNLFSNLISNVLSLPSSIGAFIDDMRDAVVGKLVSVIDGIKELPDKIVKGITRIFIPEDGFIDGKIAELQASMVALGVDAYDMSGIFSQEKPLQDITVNLYGHEVVIVDMGVVDGVLDYFRPVIRGFMYLLLVFYNFNQFMGLIGQQGVTLGGIINSVRSKEE